MKQKYSAVSRDKRKIPLLQHKALSDAREGLCASGKMQNCLAWKPVTPEIASASFFAFRFLVCMISGQLLRV
jgi:hypothetical protein